MQFDIDYLASLARMDLTIEEKRLFSSQIKDILGYIDKLKEVDIERIEPLSNPNDLRDVYRLDRMVEPYNRSIFFKIAPEVRDEYFSVPRLIKE